MILTEDLLRDLQSALSPDDFQRVLDDQFKAAKGNAAAPKHAGPNAAPKPAPGPGAAARAVRDSIERDERMAREMAAGYVAIDVKGVAEDSFLLDAELAKIAQQDADAQMAQQEADAEMARQLNQRLQAAQSHFDPVARRLQEDEDRKGIYEMQAQEDQQHAFVLQYGRDAVKRHLTPDAVAARFAALENPAFQALLLKPSVAGERNLKPGELTDAHKYTRTEIHDGFPLLITMDQQFILSDPNMTPGIVHRDNKGVLPYVIVPGTVIAEVFAFVDKMPVNAKAINKDNIVNTFSWIPKVPVEAAIEDETKANIYHIISRCWTLAKRLGPDDMCKIALVLDLNIGDDGKCMAGLMARLYASYAQMIDKELVYSLRGHAKPAVVAAASAAAPR